MGVLYGEAGLIPDLFKYRVIGRGLKPAGIDQGKGPAEFLNRGEVEIPRNPWLIGDMPYMSYQASDESAVLNAGRFMAQASCDGIKLEGGQEGCSRVRAIVAAGIPVMGHLGLTPQSVSSLGGFRLQGKSGKQAKKIVDDAQALEDAGCMAILLELVPEQVCALITERAKVPIIGLGSGPRAHGQLLIFHDMFGLYPRFTPKMAKQFANAGKVIAAA